MEVYDRWGGLLYVSEDYATHGWDGTVGGRAVPEGVYMWVIHLTSKAGRRYRRSGMVTLLR